MNRKHLAPALAAGVILAAGPAAAAAPAPNGAKTHTNSIGVEFVLIPAGTFQMGCSSDKECDVDKKPRHRVTISKPFYLGKYEVTQKQWEAVMGNNPSKFKGPDLPVERVSWNDAQEFIKRLNAMEGHKRYRLPTEAEWEYAARAGSETAYSFGDSVESLKNYAWYKANSGMKTHPVGKKRPNPWGLYDMHGNVWEWVGDWFGKKQYADGSAVDPVGPDKGKDRVLRGGSWDYVAKYCRSSHRDYDKPTLTVSNDGFRLLMTAE